MPLIEIDISGRLPDVKFDINVLREQAAALAEMCRSEWIRQAQRELHSSAADYIAGIQPVEISGNWASVTLVGDLPNDVENGKAPFDMKPGLLAGPNAKMGKSGRFNTVPFRHGTPGTTGKRVGTPMPITGLSAKDKPVSAIYVAARKLSPSLEGSGGKTIWGGRTGDFGGYGIQTQLPVKGGRPGAYTFKASPYAGMVKTAKTYGKATQNQYTTFRRVSENSNPNSWWHPGLQAKHLAERVRIYLTGLIRSL